MDLVFLNEYFVRIAYTNSSFLEEQSMDTMEQKGTRQLNERRKEGLRIA